MDDEPVLYVYKCSECNYAGQTHFPDDGHDGAAHACHACGAQVFLEWDGGVTFDVARQSDPLGEARRWREHNNAAH